MLILVGRIKEAEDMAEAMAAYRDRLCVLTSDFRVNSMGDHRTTDEAQVVVTTQEKLRRAVKAAKAGRPDERFNYLGERRAVISWDEAMSFNRPVVLDPTKVAGLIDPMLAREAAEGTGKWGSASDCLYGWVKSCIELSSGATTALPDLTGFITLDDLEGAVGSDERLARVVQDLRVVNGESAKVLRSGDRAVVVTHFPEIPREILPVIVTDASAEVNVSYRMMRQRDIVRDLKPASKSYARMTIRVVPMTASRSAFTANQGKQARAVLDTVAEYIRSIPGQEVLVIGYTNQFKMKGERHRRLGEALLDRFPSPEHSRIKGLTYGQHTSTNVYRDIRHVVLMGLNYTSDAVNVATTAAAQDLDLLTSNPSAEDIVDDMKDGMLMDHTLQAVLRGHGRLGANGQCGECEVVVIQTKSKGLTDAQWAKMFPDATLLHDKTLAPELPLSANMKALSAIIERRKAAGDIILPGTSLYGEMKISRQSYIKMVQKDAWQKHYKNLGLEVWTVSPKEKGYRVIPGR